MQLEWYHRVAGFVFFASAAGLATMAGLGLWQAWSWLVSRGTSPKFEHVKGFR